MKSPRIRQQAGYALILMVLGLMGVGGVVIAGFTQQAKQDVDQQRYQHNQRVLEEAKQALLMYAFRYPEITGNPNRGPGRLPCPDTDNTGTPNGLVGTFCIDGGGDAMVGRFPWNANGMEFYDARDASGQRLWYAVSQDFNNMNNASVINSDSVGSITIHDQNGQRLYDGAVEGIVAVIIAPGPAIDRNGVAQDRSIANGDDPQDTVADTDPGIVNPANYLDLFGGLDNADFINDDSNDGFVLGPIDDLAAEELIVNDQIILVTAEDVIAMAQKATLQAYREAFETYLSRPGFDRYPWLDPYNSAGALTTYDAEINPPAAPAPIVGRVPAIFEDYFAPSTSGSEPFISEVTMKFTVDGEQFEGREFEPTASFDAAGNLDVPAINGGVYTAWAWDGSPLQAPTQPVDGIWESCPYVTGTEEDCNQDLAGNFIGGGFSPMWLSVRKYTITFSAITQFPIADRTLTPFNYVPPTATRHAYIEAEFDGPAYVVSVTWEEDEEFQAGHDIFPAGNTGNLTYDAGDTVTVGVRYYPELPRWIESNNWHDMVQAAYSLEMAPGGAGACIVGTNCLLVDNVGGNVDDVNSLLVLSGGTEDLDPGDTDLSDVIGPGAPNFFADDLGQIFEDDNNDLDRTFDNRPTAGLANDVILVME